MRWIFLSALLTLNPLISQAQTIDFGTQCLVAPFRACATLAVTLVFHEAINEQEVRFRLSNLQGTRGFESGMRALKVVEVGGLAANVPTVFASTPRHFSSEGNAIANGVADVMRGIQRDAYGHASTYLEHDGISAFYGCDYPQQALSDFYGSDATCGGFVTYSWTFATGTRLAFTKETFATFRWFASADGDSNGTPAAFGSCRTGLSCVQVTPEPVSLILLGSGLAGLVAIRKRQRARINTSETILCVINRRLTSFS